MTPNEAKQLVADKLLAWANGEAPKNPLSGTCQALREELGPSIQKYLCDLDTSDLVTLYAEDWEHHSGSALFPVPDPKIPGDRYYAYLLFEYHIDQSKNMWIGEYGNLRRDLCQFIADKLLAEIQQEAA